MEEHTAAKLSSPGEVQEVMRSLTLPHRCSLPQAIALQPFAPLPHACSRTGTSHAFPSCMPCVLLVASPQPGHFPYVPLMETSAAMTCSCGSPQPPGVFASWRCFRLAVLLMQHKASRFTTVSQHHHAVWWWSREPSAEPRTAATSLCHKAVCGQRWQGPTFGRDASHHF